jgi:class 3 adenylate cyclase
VDLEGCDAIISGDGPSVFVNRLTDLICSVQEAARTHHVTFLGSDIDRDGGKIILTAGAPDSFENDEERCLRAARTIIEKDYGLPLRIGINRGRVFAGEIGPLFRRTYTVMGDAVNLAARLMQAAPPGQILTTTDVLERSEACFAVNSLGRLSVKGSGGSPSADRA